MNFKAYVAEFVGTFALVWVGIYAIHHLGHVPGGLVGIALAHGLAIALLASATMYISGGHLNPAVTIGMLMTKRIKLVDAVGYIFAQFAAGFIAAYAIGAVPVFDGATQIAGTTIVGNGTPIFQQVLKGTLNESSQAYSVWMLEAIATFFLMLVILGTAVDKRAHKMGGLYIGLAVTMGILAIGPFTGAAMNPARWLGPNVMSEVWMNEGMTMKWLAFGYVVGPITGAILAAIVYQAFFVSKEQLVEEAG